MSKKKPNADQMIAAINRRDIELLRKLLADGGDLNVAKNYTAAGNRSLLSISAGSQFLEGVELLLKLGADIKTTTVPDVNGEGGGSTALHYAINGADKRANGDDLAKRLKIVDLLLRAGADPNAVSKNGSMPLCDAARAGYVEICKRLIDAGSEVKTIKLGCIPPLLSAAAGFGRPEAHRFEKIANLLLEHGAPVDGESAGGVTALMGAAFRGAEDLVKLFLERGANANCQAKSEGQTPLISAALYFRWDALDEERQQLALRIVKQLVESGADPDLRNHKGESAADLAALGGSPLVADYLRNCS